ncbi:MAG: peptidylprolyl isomerase [Myxococcaceae bacterium]|nr:peptidylprolyl isomerase [Myxococcaceae bacterium]
MKPLHRALGAGALLVATLASAELVDRVAAVVNGDIIPYSEVEQRAAPELTAANHQGDPAQRNALKHRALQTALDQLIAEKLLEKEMDDLGIVVTDQEADLAVEDMRKQNNMDPEQFEQALRQEGYTLSQYKDFMKKHLRQLKLVNLKVRSKVKVSEKDLRAEYDKLARLEQADAEVHARHILIKVPSDAKPEEVEAARKKAQAIAEEARQPGVDFAELAKQKSEGPSREDGGDLGFFKRGVMLPEVEKAAFSLPIGGVSDPIRSRYGWHVLKVEERRSGSVKPFEEMKAELQERIMREQLDHYTAEHVKELRSQAAVEVKLKL